VERFFLGTHQVDWLARTALPLFVARQRLAERKTFPRATCPWSLDSGGFNELKLHGGWRSTAREYVRDVRRFQQEVGRMLWASPQDWMCEPEVLERTGLDVDEHQRRTVANFLELRSLAPELPIIPVLQGWSFGDYMRCVELYEDAGVRLAAEPLVGVGTVCRRQGTMAASNILAVLHSEHLRMHGYGYKRTGLRRDARYLVSADSMAWSENATHHAPLPGHTHKSCSNCIEWAERWRAETLEMLGMPALHWREVEALYGQPSPAALERTRQFGPSPATALEQRQLALFASPSRATKPENAPRKGASAQLLPPTRQR